VRNRANKQHILTKKDPKRKRQLRNDVVVSPSDEKRIRQLLPSL